MCHTAKKLTMQRIFLSEKKEGETSTGFIYSLIPRCSKSILCSWILRVRAASYFFRTCFLAYLGFWSAPWLKLNHLYSNSEHDCLLSQQEVMLVVNRKTQCVSRIKNRIKTPKDWQKTTWTLLRNESSHIPWILWLITALLVLFASLTRNWQSMLRWLCPCQHQEKLSLVLLFYLFFCSR